MTVSLDVAHLLPQRSMTMQPHMPHDLYKDGWPASFSMQEVAFIRGI